MAQKSWAINEMMCLLILQVKQLIVPRTALKSSMPPLGPFASRENCSGFTVYHTSCGCWSNAG